MAKRIIILERLGEPSDNAFRYVLWAMVPAARVSGYANPAATSAYPGATAAELQALQTGAVTEQVGVIPAPAGTPIATIQAGLIAQWTAFQAQVNAANKTIRYGTFWDDTPAWTAAGTA